MNRLTKIYQYFIELSWVQKLMVVVVLMLTATFIFRTITPELAPLQPQVLQNIAAGPVNLENIEFRGTYPSVPARLPIATIEYTDVSEQLLQSIFTAFAISNTEIAENVWSGSEYQVAKAEPPTLYVVARTDVSRESPNTNQINTQIAVEEATKIINGLYSFGPKPQVVLDEVEVLGVDTRAPDGPKNNNVFIRVPFTFFIEQTPIYLDKETYHTASIVLNASYELQKAEFRPYTLEATLGKSYSTVLPTEAVNRINNNQAAVQTYYYDGPNHADFSQIDSGVLNEIDLEYRFDLNSNTAYPYYNFTGTIKNSAGYDIETKIITPALKTNFTATE